MSLLSWMPFVMQGLSLLSNVLTSSNSSSATSSNRGGQEFNNGNETTTGSLTAPQQIGSTQISTPTGFGTYSNQGSVTNANMMSFMSSILSNIMNAGSQASAKKIQQRRSGGRTNLCKGNAGHSVSGHSKGHDRGGHQSNTGGEQRSNSNTVGGIGKHRNTAI